MPSLCALRRMVVDVADAHSICHRFILWKSVFGRDGRKPRVPLVLCRSRGAPARTKICAAPGLPRCIRRIGRPARPSADEPLQLVLRVPRTTTHALPNRLHRTALRPFGAEALAAKFLEFADEIGVDIDAAFGHNRLFGLLDRHFFGGPLVAFYQIPFARFL